MELFFDTETSGLFNFKTARYTDTDFPWVVQLGAVLAEDGIAYAEFNVIIQPDGRAIEEGAQKVHNISTELADKVGLPETTVMSTFIKMALNAQCLVAHNFTFDSQLMAAMFHRNGNSKAAKHIKSEAKSFCTMKESTNLCKLKGPYGWKWPKLAELHRFLFNEEMIGAHDAMYDIKATMKCYYKMKNRGLVKC